MSLRDSTYHVVVHDATSEVQNYM